MNNIIQYALDHPYQVVSGLLGIYEIFARQIPTTGNWSLVHNLAKILDKIIKNKTPEPEVYLETTSVAVKESVNKIN